MTNDEFDKLEIPKCLDRRDDPELLEVQRLEREAKAKKEKKS